MCKIKYKKYIVFFVIFIGIVGGLFLTLNSSFTKHASAIIGICAEKEYRPACYDREIPKLMDIGLSMEEAFAITRIIQKKDDSYVYCHVLGHNLSAKETAKDPSRWKEVVTRAPSGMCSNGGIHGAFQERFRAEALPEKAVVELEPILSDICKKRDDWNPTKLEQATCTHAIGHLAMYVTGGSVYKSLSLCERVAFNEDGYDFRQICFDGVFMQIFQPLEPEDYTLIEGKEQTLQTIDTFCRQFTEEKYGSCRSESWPLYEEKIEQSDVILNICSTMKDISQKNRCYSAIFYAVIASVLHLQPDKIEVFCMQFPQDIKSRCFANAASRIFEVDWQNIPDAVSMCKIAEKYGAETVCYKELIDYSTYNFYRGSKEFLTLCHTLPKPWKGRCLSQN